MKKLLLGLLLFTACEQQADTDTTSDQEVRETVQDIVDSTLNAQEQHLTTSEFLDEFKAHPDEADKKYNGRSIELSGKVSEVEGNSVIIHGDGIDLAATFSGAALKVGDDVTFGGNYVGWEKDEILGMPVVKMEGCVVM